MVKILLLTFLILILFIPIIYFNSPNYFVATTISIARQIEASGHIPQKPVANAGSFWDTHYEQFIHYPGSAILYAIVSIIGGMCACLLTRLPILIIYIYLVMALIFKLFLNDNKKYIPLSAFIAFIFTLHYIALYPHTWMISYHSLGYFSHLTVIYILMKIALRDILPKRDEYVVLMLTYLIGVINYYASSVFSIAFVLGFSISSILFYKINRINKIISIPLLFLLLFILFDYIFYVTIAHPKVFTHTIHYIISSLINILTSAKTSEKLFQFGAVYQQTRSVAEWALIIFQHLYIIIVPLLVYLWLLYNSMKNKNVSYIKLIIILSASLLAALSESVSYAYILGGLNFRYFSLYVSVVITSLLLYLNKYKLKVLTLLAISLIILADYGVVFKEKMIGTWSIKPALSNLSEYTTLSSLLTNNIVIYTNFQISGELRFAHVCSLREDRSIINNPFVSRIYELYNISITNNVTRFISLFYQTIVIFSLYDFITPVWGDVWGYVIPPLGFHFMDYVLVKLNICYYSNNFIVVYV